jgi:hypothetical protein
MNTASGVPLHSNPSTAIQVRIPDAEAVLEEAEHIIRVGYDLSYEQCLWRVKELCPWSNGNLRGALFVVMKRNLARGYYWSDRMVWECLKRAFNEEIFKGFVRPHLLIIGTLPETKLYNVKIKRDASVLVHCYLIHAGRRALRDGVVLPYTVRHHIQKFIFYWKTPDVKYEPSWIVREDISDGLLNMFRFLTEPGANPTQGPLREEDPFIRREERQQISQIIQRPQLPQLPQQQQQHQTQQQQRPRLIDSSEGAIRLVGTFTSPSQGRTISAEREELERREREHRQALNDKFNALSRFPLR